VEQQDLTQQIANLLGCYELFYQAYSKSEGGYGSGRLSATLQVQIALQRSSAEAIEAAERFLGDAKRREILEPMLIDARFIAWQRRQSQPPIGGARPPGRPRARTKDAVVAFVRELKGRGEAWKDITKAVNQRFGTKYPTPTLQKYYRLATRAAKTG
jgi:hypothetical protein